MEKKTFKEKWNEVDETCPACGNVTKEVRGLTRQNIKKLFRKPTAQDWVILIIIILLILGSFSYRLEIKQYREMIENPKELCLWYYDIITYEDFDEVDIQDIKIKDETQT